MKSQSAISSPTYKQSLDGLLRLHVLALIGRNDDPEADAIRASLEEPWRGLSELERSRITGLSADLDSIGELPKAAMAMNSQAQWKLVEAFESLHNGEGDRALELLRRWGNYLDAGVLAYLRGSVWRRAGEDAVASLFFEEAARLAPENGSLAGMGLHALHG